MFFQIPFKHILKTIVAYGLPFAILISFVHYLLDGYIRPWSFILNFFGFGLFMGILTLYKQREDLFQFTGGAILPEHWYPVQEKQVFSSMTPTEITEIIRNDSAFKKVKFQVKKDKITCKTHSLDSFWGQRILIEKKGFENDQHIYRIRSQSVFSLDQMSLSYNLRNVNRVAALIRAQ
ncbi:MAG TPA: hypothetical protein VJ917_01380 [Saprospiraceae bacterium]|nr:hypothetical protein [Saprospiraceae bacterium]